MRKTVEEKAERYANEMYQDAKEWDAWYDGYMGGYTEAMRWRDPKVELPEIVEPVIVKYRTAKNVEKHGIAKYFELWIGNPWTIEGSTGREVVGWRPIE